MPRYRKILVVLDLSSDSDPVVDAARDMAGAWNAQVVALHVVEFIPVEPLGESLMPTVQIEDALIERARAKLAEIGPRLGAANPVLRVEAGSIKAEVLRVAEDERVDLIVVGSHERHGLAILVNFTEDAVLHAAHCDVLAVRLR
jgi:universal stress protein A